MLAQNIVRLRRQVSRKRLPITVIVTTAAATAGTMASCHTPMPRGSHVVGCADVMVGKTKEGTLMRIFYPAKGVDLSNTSSWTKWYLGEEYTKGMASFIAPSIPSIFNILFNWKMRGALVPAVWEAPLIDDIELPVVVFSHGLSASRTFYSSVCSDIASHGFFVVAVEHRDTSASASFTLSESGEQQWIYFKTLSPQENEYNLRQEQVKVRVSESIRAMDVVERLNSGEVKNELDSNFDLSQFRGRLNLGKAVISGHSFGGATTISTLAQDHRFKVGVALDPWMFPLKDDLEDISKNNSKPLICINTEAFQSEANMEALKKIEADNTVFVTIKGTVHQNQCDSPFLAGPIGRVVTGASSALDYNTAMEVNNKLVIHFICKHLGMDGSELIKMESELDLHQHLIVYGLYTSSKKIKGLTP